MNFTDEIYDQGRIIEVTTQLRSIEALNKEACLMATQCQDIVMIHKKIREYTEKEPFVLKDNPHSKKASKIVRECLKQIAKACDRYLKKNHYLLARIVLIRERSKVALERCCRCESMRQGLLQCPMLETLADLNFDDRLKIASLGEKKKKGKEGGNNEAADR